MKAHHYELAEAAMRARAVRRSIGAGVLGISLAWAALAGASAPGGATPSNKSRPAEVVEVKDSRLKFEINDTDGDGGVQVFLDADEWSVMSIYDPGGRRIFTATTKGRMLEQGGTELFLESAEPSFSDLSLEQLLQRWPEGEYAFRGRGLDGQVYVGSAHLTHDIPDGPTLVSPIEGDGLQDPNATLVEWEPVADPNGSPIIGYQVLVVQSDTGLTGLPKVALDVTMPPGTTSLQVPPGFLLPNTEYEWEVLAVEASGNQTLSSSFFTTSG